MDSLQRQAAPKCFCNIEASVEGSHGMKAPGSPGVPPAPSLAQPRPSPPLGSTGNGAMALLRPGSMPFPPTGCCLQHPIEPQRRPSGERCRLPGSSMAMFARSARNRRGGMPQQEQGAGGTPALPGVTPLLRESRRSRAEGRRPMQWGGGARPGNRFFSQLTSMHRIRRTKHWCSRSRLAR